MYGSSCLVIIFFLSYSPFLFIHLFLDPLPTTCFHSASELIWQKKTLNNYRKYFWLHGVIGSAESDSCFSHLYPYFQDFPACIRYIHELPACIHHIHDFPTCIYYIFMICLPVSTYLWFRFSYLYQHIHDFPTCIYYIFTIFLPVSTTYFLHCNKYLSYMNSVHDKKLNETKSRRRKENIALHNFKQGVLLHLTWCAHYTEGSKQMGDILQ